MRFNHQEVISNEYRTSIEVNKQERFKEKRELLDTVTFRMDIRLNPKTLTKNGWFGKKNKNKNSEFTMIYSKSVKGVDLHFTYLHRAGWVPSILRIDTHSLPKLIHGSNVWYFSSSDIAVFYSLLRSQFHRVGIREMIDMKDLKIEKADIAINLLLKNQHTVRRILKALKEQIVWSTRMIREAWDDGAYNYFDSKVPKRRKKYKAGSKFYDKKRELNHISMFNSRGVLRWEIHGHSREWMKRRFGRLPTLEEFYNEEAWLRKLFGAYLRYFDVYPDCLLVSEVEAEKVLSKGRSRKGWNYDLQKFDAMIELGQDAIEFVIGLDSRAKASDFRDKVLRDRFGLLQMFIKGKTKTNYNLFSMVMEELDMALRQKSVFTVQTRVKEVGPRYILPFNDVVAPFINYADIYHDEGRFSKHNYVSKMEVKYQAQLSCKTIHNPCKHNNLAYV